MSSIIYFFRQIIGLNLYRTIFDQMFTSLIIILSLIIQEWCARSSWLLRKGDSYSRQNNTLATIRETENMDQGSVLKVEEPCYIGSDIGEIMARRQQKQLNPYIMTSQAQNSAPTDGAPFRTRVYVLHGPRRLIVMATSKWTSDVCIVSHHLIEQTCPELHALASTGVT